MTTHRPSNHDTKRRSGAGPRRPVALAATFAACVLIGLIGLRADAGDGCNGGGGGGGGQNDCGACCFGTGSCLYTSMENCLELGGDFFGVQSTCNSTPCPQPGACCLPDGSCTLLASWACIDQGGQFNGVAVPCNAVQCAAPCNADLDGSGVVDVVDMLDLLAAWGTPDGDLTGDGDTDVVDLLELLSAWGACG